MKLYFYLSHYPSYKGEWSARMSVWALLSFLAISQTGSNATSKPEIKFPANFLLGASSSAYQIEGGWNADGKGKSMWDDFLHEKPDIVEDFTNGDIAADSYHLYERDVEILKHLGAKSYRFSMSWSRILPNGTTNYINPYGIAYYRRLINLLLANDIIPLVTLYHWDLPIAISDQGGWLNDKTVDLFEEYARIVFLAFGDKVKYWITVNEPFVHCSQSYGYGRHPPLIKSPGIAFYVCGRIMLLAHAKAYHLYDTEFRKLQMGQVGIALNAECPIAASDSTDDTEAVEDYLAFHLGQYIDPILKGDYPQRLVDRVAAASAKQGYTYSRLRPLNDQEKAEIYGSVDFFGINHYTSVMVYRNESVVGMYDVPSFDDDAGCGDFMDPSWPKSSFSEMTAYAPGFYAMLLYLKETYNNPIVYITESGFPLTAAEGLNDDEKVNYLRSYLSALLDAKEAGSNCQGYFFWSLMDSLEWECGYGYKFGLYQVDYKDPHRSRTPRKSALVYKEIIRTGTIDYNHNPDPYQQERVDYPLAFFDLPKARQRLITFMEPSLRWNGTAWVYRIG